MKQSIPPIAVRLMTAVAAGLFALAAREVGLRVTSDANDFERLLVWTQTPPEVQWVAHPFLPFVGRRSHTYRTEFQVDSETVRIDVRNNADGFRTHELPAERDPDAFVVVCLGGSTTWGASAATNSDTWPEQLEDLLASAHPERPVRVYNFGTPQMASAFSTVVYALIASRLRPDVVIVYHGVNEADALIRKDQRWDQTQAFHDMDPAPLPLLWHLPAWMRHSWAALWIANRIDERIAENNLARLVMMPMRRQSDSLPLDVRPYLHNLQSIGAMVEGDRGHLLTATFQFRDAEPVQKDFNRQILRWAAERGVDIVDADAAFPDHDTSINYDPCHFTDEGRRRMAKLFFDAIEERGWADALSVR